MNQYLLDKKCFELKLKEFTNELASYIESDGEWTIRGFIDIFENIYPLSSDTKIISKLLELHIFPHFLQFAKSCGFRIELAKYQNYYPDLTFIKIDNEDIKFAVDLKTTYRDDNYQDFCNGFTLGSHGEYFCNRNSTKNINYPYNDYSGHFILGIIYSRIPCIDETKKYRLDELSSIPSVANNFTFFASEKWKIASDKGGSGNTANIGSIGYIPDILSENGVFAKAGEEYFDEYWINYGKIQVPDKNGKFHKITTFKEFLEYRKCSLDLFNPKKERESLKAKKIKVSVPPLKIQGIKTKIVPAIIENVSLNEDSVWFEPFMGSGVVGFNVAPKHAIFADTNPYIINFYNDIKSGKITSQVVRKYLEDEGKKLSLGDDEYYYEVRKRFNENHNSLDFLFLNRACFNGMMRFNKDGNFNVPYCHKPQRFSKAYITKIVNQVKVVETLIKENDWQFICQSYEDTITLAKNTPNAFIYCDPPYIDRNTDYYDGWNEEKELMLKNCLVQSEKKFMLSTWDYNKYRRNEYITSVWGFCNKLNISHFYHVGAKEDNREAMMEALLTNY